MRHLLWRRDGAGARTALGPCTAPPRHVRRCSWHGKGSPKPPPHQCSYRCDPFQTCSIEQLGKQLDRTVTAKSNTCCVVLSSVLSVVFKKILKREREKKTTNNAFTFVHIENKEPQNKVQLMVGQRSDLFIVKLTFLH